MPEISLLCPEPIRKRVQGVGIRFLEMARELMCAGHKVSLWVPNEDIPKSRPEWIRPVWSPSFRTALKKAEAVLIHGHISDLYFSILNDEGIGEGPPLIVDLYDPFLIENLQYTPSLGESLYERDRAVLFRQLEAGDFFLTSSESQRLFYIGLLIGLGCLDAGRYHDDPTLRSWVSVVPFGVHPLDGEELRRLPGKIKGVLPGVSREDLVVFFGGVYEWYDPMVLLEGAEPLIRDGRPIRIIFCENPNPEITPQGKLGEVHRRAEAWGWLNRHVFMIPWFPYEERFQYYRDVDIAVSLHCPSLETDLSLRTRLLDYMNAGLPIIATDGGEGSARVVEAGAGAVVAPRNPLKFREALESLLNDESLRRQCGERGRQWVQTHMRWNQTLRPLVQFCEAPKKTSTMTRTAGAPLSSTHGASVTLGYLLRELRRYQSTYGLGGAVRRAWRLWGKGI